MDITGNGSATLGMGGESEVSVNVIKYDSDNGLQWFDGGTYSTGATTGANIEGSASLQLTVGESPTGINVSKCVSGKFAVGGKACVGVSNTGKPFVTLGIGSGFGGGTSASVRWTEEYKWSDITRGDK